MLAAQAPPRHESAFRLGQLGEESVARALEHRNAYATLLHDRRMPGGYGNIDHLAVAPSGVYVIDAKNIAGSVRIARPLRGEARLMINKRNRSRLLEGLQRQVDAVRRALDQTGRDDVPIVGVLCFTKAEFPLLGSMQARGLRLCHPRALRRRLKKAGPLSVEAIDALARDLARSFPPA